jgi:NAD(P)-dependent dehydrogenase (short-subunit alcohol dehydrogenase family)
MDLQLKDKVVVITGGAKGIGAAIARTSADEGAVPVIIDRDQAALAEIEKQIVDGGGSCFCTAAELSRAEECRRTIIQAQQHYGRIDALVNNAGIYRAAETLDVTEEHWDAIMNINAKAVFFATQAALIR